MNIWAWIGIGGFIVLTLLTFLDKNRGQNKKSQKQQFKYRLLFALS